MVEVMGVGPPLVEIADDADGSGVRRPDGEVDAAAALALPAMGAQFFVELEVAALLEEVDVVLGQQGIFLAGVVGFMIVQFSPFAFACESLPAGALSRMCRMP